MNILLASDFITFVAKYWYISSAVVIVTIALLVYGAVALNKLISDVRENSELKQARRRDDEDRLKKQRERARIIKEDLEEENRIEKVEEPAVSSAQSEEDELPSEPPVIDDLSGENEEQVPENEDYPDKILVKEELSITENDELNGQESSDENNNASDGSSPADTKEIFEDMATKKTEKETVKAKKESVSEKKTSETKEKAPVKKVEKKNSTSVKAEASAEENKTEVTAVSAETADKKAKEIAEKGEIKAVYRVIYDKENKEWLIKKDGASRIIRRVKTKAEALELATQFAENQELNITVQKKDGKFQKKTNYRTMLNSDKSDN